MFSEIYEYMNNISKFYSVIVISCGKHENMQRAAGLDRYKMIEFQALTVMLFGVWPGLRFQQCWSMSLYIADITMPGQEKVWTSLSDGSLMLDIVHFMFNLTGSETSLLITFFLAALLWCMLCCLIGLFAISSFFIWFQCVVFLVLMCCLILFFHC